MAAPTFIQEAETAWNTSTTPKTTGSFTTAAGDILVGFGVAEDTANTTSLALTGGSLTWTQQQLINAASSTWVAGWTATATAASITATVTKTQSGGTAKQFGGNVLTFRGSDGVGTSAKAGPTSGAPSVTITTTQDNSAVVVFVGDWAALATARTWRTVNSITPTAANGFEVTYSTSSGVFTVYGAYYSDVGLAGAKTVGLTAPTGQTFSIVAIEVKGTAGGTNVTVTAPAAAVTAGASAPALATTIETAAGGTTASAVGPVLAVSIDETAGAVIASGPAPTVSTGGSPVTVVVPPATVTAGAAAPAVVETTLPTAASATASVTAGVPTVQVPPSAAAATASAVGPSLVVAITVTPAASTASSVAPSPGAAIAGAVATATATGVGPGMTVQVLAPAANAFAYAAPPTNFASSVLPVMVGDGAPVVQPDVPTHGRR